MELHARPEQQRDPVSRPQAQPDQAARHRRGLSRPLPRVSRREDPNARSATRPGLAAAWARNAAGKLG
jgi:hypothetical protein